MSGAYFLRILQGNNSLLLWEGGAIKLKKSLKKNRER